MYAPISKFLISCDGILNEAIRGIFDGLQSVGRSFSVHYFYAKYVARNKTWVALYSEIGVIPTAIKIIEKFNHLTKHQKQIFIDESFKFFSNKYYGKKLFTEEDLFAPNFTYFPEEPKPPPKNAVALYKNTLKSKKCSDRTLKIVPWEELDEKTQMYYMKKLYQMTRDYIKDYEAFVKKMTPNDMLEYFTQRCDDLENSSKKWFCTNRAVRIASTDFIYPFPSSTFSAEYSDDGQEACPQIFDTHRSSKKRQSHSLMNKNNPFSELVSKPHPRKQSSLVQKLCSNWKNRVDSDLPSSSSDDENFSLFKRNPQQKTQRAFRKKLKKLETFYYPLEDLYDTPITSTSRLPRTTQEVMLRAEKLLLDRTKMATEERLKYINYQKQKGTKAVTKNTNPARAKTKVQIKSPRSKRKIPPIRKNTSKAPKAVVCKHQVMERSIADSSGEILGEDEVELSSPLKKSEKPKRSQPSLGLVSSYSGNNASQIPPAISPKKSDNDKSSRRKGEVTNTNDALVVTERSSPASDVADVDLLSAALHFADPNQLECEKSLMLREIALGEVELIDAGDVVSLEDVYSAMQGL